MGVMLKAEGCVEWMALEKGAKCRHATVPPGAAVATSS